MTATTWTDLLPRLRLVDLGSGATFGARHVVKVEGVEVLRVRPSSSGPPALPRAAALLHLLGVTPETPTWEVRDLVRDRGFGPPYGRDGVDGEAVRATMREAEYLCVKLWPLCGQRVRLGDRAGTVERQADRTVDVRWDDAELSEHDVGELEWLS